MKPSIEISNKNILKKKKNWARFPAWLILMKRFWMKHLVRTEVLGSWTLMSTLCLIRHLTYCSSSPHPHCLLVLSALMEFGLLRGRTSTTWWRYRAGEEAVVGLLDSLLKWKFMFNICIPLILLNWFKVAFCQSKLHANAFFTGKYRWNNMLIVSIKNLKEKQAHINKT